MRTPRSSRMSRGNRACATRATTLARRPRRPRRPRGRRRRVARCRRARSPCADVPRASLSFAPFTPPSALLCRFCMLGKDTRRWERDVARGKATVGGENKENALLNGPRNSAARRCASEPFSVIPCPPRATRQPGAAPVFATRLRAAAGRAVFFGGGAMKRGTERLTREVRRGARAGATEGAIAPTSWRAGARANEGARASAPCVRAHLRRAAHVVRARARARPRGASAPSSSARARQRPSPRGGGRVPAAESPRASPARAHADELRARAQSGIKNWQRHSHRRRADSAYGRMRPVDVAFALAGALVPYEDAPPAATLEGV